MSERSPFGATPVIKIDGQELPDWATPLLEKVVVDDHVHLPDVAALTFRDPAGDVVRRLSTHLGSTITITATQSGDGTQEPLLVGEVTAFEHETGPMGSHAVVLAYDLSHRLCRGRRTRSWNDVTDSSIAQELAAGAGLQTAAIEATSTVHRHVSQINLTDWDFLKGRAQESGFEVAVVGGKLAWRRPTDHAEAPPLGDATATNPRLQLVVGTNLLRFRPRITTASQVDTIEARGWDPVQKRALISQVPGETLSAAVALTHAAVVKAFPGSTCFQVVDRAFSQQADVEAAAHAMSETVSSAFVEATGEALGDPRLVAGRAVSVSMSGWPHDGTYTLTSTRHTYDGQGYRTSFVCSGRQERSALGLMTLGATKGSQSAGGNALYGVVVGIVTDVSDPENLHRVRVQLPWLSDDYVTGWARVTQLGAGAQRGATFLPEVNDEVLVAFDRGDTRVPYVIGQLYNGVDKPLHDGQIVDAGAGQVTKRGLVSRKGHELLFDEDKGIRLSTGDGSYRLELDASGTVITIDSGGTISIHGTGKITIKGDSDVDLSAGGNLQLTAANIKIAADAQLDLGGGGVAKLHAGVVQIN